MSTGHYILEGRKPVYVEDAMDWARWFESSERRVAVHHVGAFQISTVFLGLDHQFFAGPPLLFETMIFPSESQPFDYWQQRCSTWTEAEAQHETAVALVERETGLKRTRQEPGTTP